MDVVYRRGRATAAEIHGDLPDPPVAAAVRTLLRILEEKGHLRHEKDGPRHIYFPVTPRSVAQRSAVRHLIGTFFDGSRAAAVAALLDESERPLYEPKSASRSLALFDASAPRTNDDHGGEDPAMQLLTQADSARSVASVYAVSLLATVPLAIVAIAASSFDRRAPKRGR